ncbi:MAG: DUF2911 domain-containing protein [Balneola sp.]
MKNTLFLITLFLLVLTGCSKTDTSNKAAFITKLGNDTLAVEVFEKTEHGISAKVILRSPTTTLTSYYLTLDGGNGIKNLAAYTHSLEDGFESEGQISLQIENLGDSLRIERLWQGETRSSTIENQPGVLPFIDMVHWPFEIAFNNARSFNSDTIYQPLISGSRISDFIVATIRPDSMTIRHPSRGVMGARVSETGNLQFLDAGLTTRKLKVYREPANSLNIAQLGAHFAQNDLTGNPFGELSSAEEATFYIGDTEFIVSYGSPKKRGRELFGAIVPWGERWRTGANRATHFYTSKDLVIEGLEVPAGEYTLFTVPEPDGGTLIINKQTGQNGRSYDESKDLGRITMTILSKEDITEAFTITVEETNIGGNLNLIWGQAVFSVNFKINPS